MNDCVNPVLGDDAGNESRTAGVTDHEPGVWRHRASKPVERSSRTITVSPASTNSSNV
jgi:hypothetical protein